MNEQWITVASRIFFFLSSSTVAFQFGECEMMIGKYILINRFCCWQGMINSVKWRKKNQQHVPFTNPMRLTNFIHYALFYYVELYTYDEFGLLFEQQTWWEWWNLTYDYSFFGSLAWIVNLKGERQSEKRGRARSDIRVLGDVSARNLETLEERKRNDYARFIYRNLNRVF